MKYARLDSLEKCSQWLTQEENILPWFTESEWHEPSSNISPLDMSGALPTTTPRIPDETSGSSTVISAGRRSSLALSLHSNLGASSSLAGSGNELSAFQVVGSARRRLSNVGDVVSRKISHTIGWRTLSASIDLTVSQGTSLCAQYIRQRLKRSGIFQRKLGLKRMRSAILLPGGTVVGEVYPELTAVGGELEKMHPTLFNRVSRQIGCGSFANEQSAGVAVVDVAREIIRNGEMTWSKVVAIYAVAGGIAVDCVRQGKPEYLPAIQRGMTDVLEEDLAAWIQANGGWGALATRYRPAPKIEKWRLQKITVLFIITTFAIGVMSIILRLLIF